MALRPQTASLLKTGIAYACLFGAFALVRSVETGSAVFAFASGDLIVLVLAAVLLAKACAEKKHVAGLGLGITTAILYFALLRSGFIQISGVELVAFTLALAIGVFVGPVRQHLFVPFLLLMAACGAATGWLEHATSKRIFVLAIASMFLALSGIAVNWTANHVRTAHLPLFQYIRKQSAPLSVFLGLYGGCIVLFSALYRAVNNTIPLSFAVSHPGEALRPPAFSELLTYSLSLMVNSSYANYNDIIPRTNACRALALSQSLLGIIFFALYLQLLLSPQQSIVPQKRLPQ